MENTQEHTKERNTSHGKNNIKLKFVLSFRIGAVLFDKKKKWKNSKTHKNIHPIWVSLSRPCMRVILKAIADDTKVFIMISRYLG